MRTEPLHPLNIITEADLTHLAKDINYRKIYKSPTIMAMALKDVSDTAILVFFGLDYSSNIGMEGVKLDKIYETPISNYNRATEELSVPLWFPDEPSAFIVMYPVEPDYLEEFVEYMTTKYADNLNGPREPWFPPKQ
jgi:hypothetical protein